MTPLTEDQNRSVTISAPACKSAYCRTATLFYLLEGGAVFTYDGRRVELRRSDILVINRGTEYLVNGEENLLLASLSLTGESFETACDGVRRFVDCCSAAGSSEHFDTLRGLLRQMILTELYIEENGEARASLAVSWDSLYYQLLDTIVTRFVKSGLPRQEKSPALGRSAERREEIERYMNAHFMDSITLDDLAKALSLSKTYLSKAFSRTFGVSFSQYLKELRLRHAMNDLLYTDRPITQIVFDNGFSSSSFFNRAFREKFKENPREARERFMRENGGKPVPEKNEDLRRRARKLLSLPGEEAGQGAVCRFSSISSQPLRLCWGSLINLGSASELLRTDMQSHIKILSRWFTYARFWDPFSEEMLLNVNSAGANYNFLRLDQLFDCLLACGMKPFVVFEPKPERVNEGVDSSIIKSRHDSRIDAIQAWNSIVGAFMRHIVQKYGVEEVSQWKFELTYGGYHLRDREPLESFLELFQGLSDAVRRYAPRLMIGGPTLLSGELDAFRWVLTGLKERRCKPDFISMISFAYEIDRSTHRYSIRSIDEEYLLKDVKRFREIMEEYGLADCPLYITEWNETVADRNFVNDSCYRGAYIIKNLLDVSPYVDAIGYFSGTDLRSEYYDSGPLLQGGNGLLSRDGILKPAGIAIKMMERLYGYCVGRGHRFLITTDGWGNFAIVLHNKRRLGYYFHKTPEWKIEKEELSRYREDEDSVSLALELTDMENGEYHIRIQRVNSRHGSVLDLWKDLDYSQNLSRQDIQYMQRVCQPHLSVSAQRVTNRRLLLEARLEPDEFILIEVHRNL